MLNEKQCTIHRVDVGVCSVSARSQNCACCLVAGDMYRIAVKWTEYAPRVVDVYPELFAEMFGFIYATVELQLPFTLVKSIVVSVTTTPNREGWRFIDDLKEEDVCNVPSDARLPIALHYCKR